MRWFFLCLSCLSCPSSSSAQVLINEVYYDHPGRDDGYEFVEIINLFGDARGLLGCRLEFHDGSSTRWVAVWEAQPGDTIPGSGLFVIGGEDVAPPPEAVVELALQNGPDAVRLVDGGVVLDLLGYGALDSPAYFEGRSAPDVPSGSSLSRVPDGGDTNDNLVDFAVMVPSPGAFNVPRHDAELRSAAGTPVRDVLEAPGIEIIRLDVLNRGLSMVPEVSVVVELRDSTRLGSAIVASTANHSEIPPADSVEIAFAIDLTPGYHWIEARMTYAPDERRGNNSVELFRRVGAPPVIISEVMSYPRSGCPEYVELLNTGGNSYDLAGHWIRDAAHSPVRVVSKSAVIGSNGLVVLTPDADALLDWFPDLRSDGVIETEGSWPSLNHTGSGARADSVVLLDGLLLAVDRVAYPPQPSGTRGQSLERVDLYPATGDHTWVLSSAPRGGSPGRRALGGIFERPTGRNLIVSPNPFHPGDAEHLSVTIPEQGVPSRAVVSVYDLDGRCVHEFGSTTQLPSVFVWGGRDSDGRTVVPGLYIVACEFFSLATNDRWVEKVVVGCARKSKR